MKIYVGNLPFTVDKAKLDELFGTFGDIEESIVISDKFSGRSKGFGFVTFKDDAAAQKAIADMNDKEVEGRNIKVNEAKPMEDRPPRRDFGGGGGRDNKRF
jgi:RNA recognition motif-containing protein